MILLYQWRTPAPLTVHSHIISEILSLDKAGAAYDLQGHGQTPPQLHWKTLKFKFFI